MLRAPSPHPLGVVGIAPVILVLQFGQPELLAVRFADALAVRHRAEPLVVPVVGIGKKQLPTMSALTTTGSRTHQERCSVPEPGPRDKSRSEELAHGRTRTAKKEEDFQSKCGKNTDRRRWVPFKPRESGSFHSAHDNNAPIKHKAPIGARPSSWPGPRRIRCRTT